MPEIITLGANLKISDRTDPHLHWNTRSGGPAISGVEQVTSPLTAMWRWSIAIPIRNRHLLRSWRVVKTRLKGRYNYLRVALCDQARINRADVGAVSGDVPYDDDAFHDDDTGHALEGAHATLAVDYAAGDNAVSVPLATFGAAGDALTAGVLFSINEWLYQVTRTETVGSNVTLYFEPPLRQTTQAGDEVQFSATALWNLESDDEGELDLRSGHLGVVRLNLVEALGRLI